MLIRRVGSLVVFLGLVLALGGCPSDDEGSAERDAGDYVAADAGDDSKADSGVPATGTDKDSGTAPTEMDAGGGGEKDASIGGGSTEDPTSMLGTDCGAQTKPEVAFHLTFSEFTDDPQLDDEGVHVIEKTSAVANFMETKAFVGTEAVFKLGLAAPPTSDGCAPAVIVQVQRLTTPKEGPSDGEEFEVVNATGDKATVAVEDYEGAEGCGAFKTGNWVGSGGTVTFAVDGSKVTATLKDVKVDPPAVNPTSSKGSFMINGTITSNCFQE